MKSEKGSSIPTHIIIDNLPRPKYWILEWAPIIISALALFVSLWSINQSNNISIVSHRPYVVFQSFAHIENNLVIRENNVLLKMCLNAPANIIKEEYSYVAVGKDGKQNKIYEKIEEGKQLIYPLEPKIMQSTYTIAFNIEGILKDTTIEKLLRRVRVDYKEVSSNRKYFFEGQWKFDKQGNYWKPVYLEGS